MTKKVKKVKPRNLPAKRMIAIAERLSEIIFQESNYRPTIDLTPMLEFLEIRNDLMVLAHYVPGLPPKDREYLEAQIRIFLADVVTVAAFIQDHLTEPETQTKPEENTDAHTKES